MLDRILEILNRPLPDRNTLQPEAAPHLQHENPQTSTSNSTEIQSNEMQAEMATSSTPADISTDISEATISKILTVNGTNAKVLDFSNDINDPDVQLFGMGTMRLSNLKKEIQKDLMRFAESIGRRPAKELMVYLTDTEGRHSSGMYFAYRMQALMEVEEYMRRPEVKRKITMMRKR